MSKTIYDRLMQCQLRMTLDCFKVNISKELCLLFKQISGIDLSSEPYPFVKNGGELQFGVTVKYTFKYGAMTIKSTGPKLTVLFLLEYKYKDLLNLPSQSGNCEIDVDHNLNFIQAKFEDSLFFSAKCLEMKLPISNLCVKINHILTLHGYEKKLSYQNHVNGKIIYLNNGLDIRFNTKDFSFDDVLYKFMILATYYSSIFYIGFPNYPSYEELLTEPDKIIKFVNMFIHDYFNDFDNLVDNIERHYLLLDMEEI